MGTQRLENVQGSETSPTRTKNPYYVGLMGALTTVLQGDLRKTSYRSQRRQEVSIVPTSPSLDDRSGLWTSSPTLTVSERPQEHLDPCLDTMSRHQSQFKSLCHHSTVRLY